MTTPDGVLWLTVQEYAELKKLSVKTVYRRIHAGLLPAEREGPRLYRIRMRAVQIGHNRTEQPKSS